jgi:hypothetical protein
MLLPIAIIVNIIVDISLKGNVILVNVINFSLSQSDNIKLLSLYIKTIHLC